MMRRPLIDKFFSKTVTKSLTITTTREELVCANNPRLKRIYDWAIENDRKMVAERIGNLCIRLETGLHG